MKKTTPIDKHPLYLFSLLPICLLLCLLSPYSNAQDPTSVAVITPTIASATHQFSLNGTFVAAQQSNLSPRIAGLVAQMHVDIGSEVKKGDTLLILDKQLEQHRLTQLQASQEAALTTQIEAQRLVDEAQRLSANKHIAQTELALRKAALARSTALFKAAQAEYETQQARIAWHTVKAPFDGVISEKLTEIGEWVTPGNPILQLVATDRVYLDIPVPQEKFSELQNISHATVLPSTQNNPVEGRISAFVPVSDSSNRTFRVRLIMNDLKQRLIPGTSATAKFTVSKPEQSVLFIPRDALLRSPDGSFSVFVIDNSDGKAIAKRRKITLDTSNANANINETVAVISGLKKQDQVVIRGNETLNQNQPVTVIQHAQ